MQFRNMLWLIFEIWALNENDMLTAKWTKPKRQNEKDEAALTHISFSKKIGFELALWN